MSQRRSPSSFHGGEIKALRTKFKAPESSSSSSVKLRDSYFVRTMETASLRMLSPNTNMLRTGSTFRALKMAMVATGSTAEISEPKAKLQQWQWTFRCEVLLCSCLWRQYSPVSHGHLIDDISLGKKTQRKSLALQTEKSACEDIWLWDIGRWIDPHLSEEINASSDYEGRDSCADHSKERNGSNVLEEVSLNNQNTHPHSQLRYSELVVWYFKLHAVT